MRRAFPGNFTPRGEERRKPARDARAGLGGTRGSEGIERRAVHRAYPHRPRPGLQPTPPGARAWPWKERGSQEEGGGGRMRLIPAAFSQGRACAHRRPCRSSRLRTIPRLPLTRMLPHPAGLLACPAPRSSREAQLIQGSPPRGLPPLTRDFCLLTFGGTSGRGDWEVWGARPHPFFTSHPAWEMSTPLF